MMARFTTPSPPPVALTRWINELDAPTTRKTCKTATLGSIPINLLVWGASCAINIIYLYICHSWYSLFYV